MNVSVIGLGYVGLPLAKSLFEAGCFVQAVDIDSSRIQNLKSEIEILNHSIQQNGSGTINLTTNFENISDSEAIFICVPTPLDRLGKPDLTALINVSREISRFARSGSIIINESTSHPGTLRNVIMKHVIEDSLIGGTLEFATAPERIDPGSSIALIDIPRVIGGITKSASLRAAEIYRKFTKEIHIVETPEVAELSKLLENTYRYLNIAFINEFHRYCVKSGFSSNDVIEAASTKPFGFQKFFPGAGIGGHCIPVDSIYLLEHSKSTSYPLSIIESARRAEATSLAEIVNRFVEHINVDEKEILGEILVYGVTYKVGVPDTRESAAIKILEMLTKLGLRVVWFDPLVESLENFTRLTDIEMVKSVLIVTPNNSTILSDLIDKGVPIFDASAMLSTRIGIKQI